MTPFLVFLSLIVAAFRPFIRKFDSAAVNVYKDLAHIYVGMNIGAGCAYYQIGIAETSFFLGTAIVLTLWEVACFIALKKTKAS